MTTITISTSPLRLFEGDTRCQLGLKLLQSSRERVAAPSAMPIGPLCLWERVQQTRELASATKLTRAAAKSKGHGSCIEALTVGPRLNYHEESFESP